MRNLTQPVYFISGIDTGVGKTVITGLLARWLMQKGVKVITQKLAQTGCIGISEDILEHRKMANMKLQECDKDFTTCPFVYPFPASPHLSAELEGKVIDTTEVALNTRRLLQNFDVVLLEGAGGLMVPITRTELTINYIAEQKLPLILVTTPKLGSINHTLLSLEACLLRNIEITALIYNEYLEAPTVISADSKRVFKEYLEKNSPETEFVEIRANQEFI